MKRTSQKQRTILYCIIFLILIIIAVVFLPSYILKNRSDSNNSPITDTRFALNTVITITLYDSQDTSILDGAFKLCNDYENILSRTLETSELYKLNHSEDLVNKVSPELAEIIEKGLQYSKMSDGSFDISIAPISQLWDFTADNPVVPTGADIASMLPYVGYGNFSINGTTVTKTQTKNELDLGGIAKGYIADKMKDYLLKNGVTEAIINLGGNILCVGDKNGELYNIGVQAPFEDQNITLASMKIADKSIVTSGIYERCFTQDGKLYHHILDPKTGYPYQNDLTSVTIISDKSVDGDALSTTCFALGYEKGMSYINSRDELDAIFVTSDGEIYYSDNLEAKYQILS